jgi:PPOX class probable F420-dependent enzyme
MAQITGKYLSVTSFKRDGSEVATPVWFVAENGRLLVETDRNSGKAKRIRHNGVVTVAPCSAGGRLKGEPIAAHARFLPETERRHVEELFGRKYRVDKVLVLPVYRLVQRLRGSQAISQDTPVILEITTD